MAAWAEWIFPDPSRGGGRGRFTVRDLVAGLSVALVLVPQSLAYAELAGMPPVTGLYAAAVAPIAGSLVASSTYLQTGPVALTALLTMGALVPLAAAGTPGYVALAALLALVVGAVRVILGLARFGLLAYLMSQPLLLGFTSGAGLLIIGSQLPSALGADPSGGRVVTGALSLLLRPASWDRVSLLLTVATILLIRGGSRIHRLFPGVLVATVASILYSTVVDFGGATVGSFPTAFALPSLDLPWLQVGQLLVPGLVIGLVGFAEPASIARTYAAEDRDPWNPNREFVSQGLANLASGLFGSFPVGGSFSRSSLNRVAGATSRWSGAVTGVLVLVFVPFAELLAPMPRAVLAGIIIAATWGLIRPRALFKLWQLSPLQALVASSTFVLTLALSPRIEQAVLLGILLSIGIHLWRELPVSIDTWTREGEIHIALEGVVWFGSAPVLEEALLDLMAREKEAEALVIHMDGVGRLDLTGAYTLKAVIDDATAAGLRTWLEGVPPHAYRILKNVLEWHPVRETPEREAEEKERERERKLQQQREGGDAPAEDLVREGDGVG